MITKVSTENREEWKKLRSQYIGGSDSAAVVGLNPFVSPYALWAEKTGKIPPFEGNLATEVGAYLEEFIAKKFEQETGKKVRRVNQSFLNSDYPFAIANIDREIVGEDAGLEIKHTSELNLKKFKGGEYPVKYYAQCVWYMAVTGKARWYLAVLIGNKEFRWFTIDRDEAEIAALMGAGHDFWELVKNNTPPLIDGVQSTTNAIKTMYTDSNENTVDLFGYEGDVNRYMAINKQIAELEAIREECTNKIKAFMQDAGNGECDRFRVSWKTQSRRTFDAKKFAEANPNIDLSDYYKETSARVFRVSEINIDKE